MAGRRRALGLGPYPTVSLAAARERAEALHRDIRENRDWLTKTICAPAALAGWGSRHQIYEANWIGDRAKTFADEIEFSEAT